MPEGNGSVIWWEKLVHLEDFIFLPGIILEILGIVVISLAVSAGEPFLLFSGTALFCCAIVVHLFVAIRRHHPLLPEDDRYSRPSSDTSPVTIGDSPIRYKDELVIITDDSITFLHYAFPLFSSGRKVLFKDIDHIEVRLPGITTGKWRLAGFGNLRTCFPLDWNRPSRDRIFHAVLKTEGMDIGFTVEHSDEVISILEERGLIALGDG